MPRYEVAKLNEMVDRITRIEQWMIQVTPILHKFATTRNNAWWLRFVEDTPYPPLLPTIKPMQYVDVTPQSPEDEVTTYDPVVVDAFERFGTEELKDTRPGGRTRTN